MKTLVISLLLFFYIISCQSNPKTLTEDYQAIGFVSPDKEIQLSENMSMNTNKFHFILFLYHDTIFQVVNRKKETLYYYFKPNKEMIDSLKSTLNTFHQTTLDKQLKLMNKNEYRGSCGPEGYFLFAKNEKMNFGLFNIRLFNYWWSEFSCKPKKLNKKKFPKMFQSLYHTFNSKQWDYFMSDDYYYKEVRLHYTPIMTDDL